MQFLNPFVLVGLAGAAIPVILHLLNLRKLRTVEFSTLTFLKELQTTKIRRLKLRQFLLLLLRTLIIISIVLAFARPALKGSIGDAVGTRARTTSVILLDNTLSMSAQNEQGQLLQQAKETAINLVDVMKEGDEMFLIRSSEIPFAVTETPLHDVAMLKTLIRETTISFRHSSLNDAIGLAASLLEKSQNYNKELYLLSDFQTTEWTHRNAAAEKLFAENVRIFASKIFSQQSNVTIDSIAVQTSIIEQGKPVAIAVTIHNYSENEVRDNAVSIFLNGTRVAQKNISITKWGIHTETFSIIPKENGWLSGKVEVESDALDEDNTKYFSLYVPENISVAFVAEQESDIQFPLLALSVNNDSVRSLFIIQKYLHSSLSRVNLNATDVLVLSNLASVTTTETEQLKLFLQRGGGIIFFPGDNTIPTQWNTLFFSPLKIMPVTQIVRTAQKGISIASMEKIDYQHPLFSGVYDELLTKKQTAHESPSVFSFLQRLPDKSEVSIIATQSNTPVLSELRFNDGVMLLYAIAPTLSWSELPRKGMFVPLMYRSILYAALRTEKSNTYCIAESPTLQLQRGKISQEKQLQIIPAEKLTGDEEFIDLAKDTSGNSLRLLATLSPRMTVGNYFVVSGEKKLASFSVNIEARESDLRSILDEEMEKFYSSNGLEAKNVSAISSSEKVMSAVLESRYGVELWKFFILCALVFALLEMFVGRTGRRESEMA
ncbi:MAG: BatA and WFA domain-containing protein [Bacteroidota bacterium]